jgi:cytochrome P450
VSDPALVRQVLLDNIDNYDKHTPAFDAVRIVLGNGMLTSGGAFWKRQRRIAQPAFHGESVRSSPGWRSRPLTSGSVPPRPATRSMPAPT